MHILLVESDPFVATSVVRFLRQLHATVQVSITAQAAIQACDIQIPDVIILDISLTGHSGIEFLHEFKSYSDWQSLPIIAWSMQSYTPAQQKALHMLGAQHVLYKPHATLQALWQHIVSLTVPSHA